MTEERIKGGLEPKLVATIDFDTHLELGREYPVKVELQGVEKGVALDIELKAFGSVKLMNEEEFYKKFDMGEASPRVTFNIKADSLGRGLVIIDAFQETHWLKQIQFDLEVKPTLFAQTLRALEEDRINPNERMPRSIT